LTPRLVKTSQASELEDVAELPLDDSGMNITPPRSMGGLAGDSGTLSPGAAPAMKPSAHGYVRTRQRLGKRRCVSCWRLLGCCWLGDAFVVVFGF